MIGAYTKLTHDEEKRLFEMCHEGKRSARDFLIKNNIGIAFNVANKLKYSFHFVSLDDLRAYALEGLIKSIDAFDYRLGFKFSTYAYTGIKNYILRKIELYETFIRYPHGYVAKHAYGKDSALDDDEKEVLKSTVYNNLSLDKCLDNSDEGSEFNLINRMVAPVESEPDYRHTISDAHKHIDLFVKNVCNPKLHELFMTAFTEGLSQSELAHLKGTSRQNISIKMKQAQRLLKRNYSKYM